MKPPSEAEPESNGAFEVICRGSSSAIFITCEHASEDFPAPWSLSEEDAWLEGTHWTHDIGAHALVDELCEHFSACAVLARFSRLIADANRPREAEDLFRRTAEGRVITLNSRVEAADRDQRLLFWSAYHAAVDREVGRSPAELLLAVHTFTPQYDGMLREMEIGVLFDAEEKLAEAVAESLSTAGFRVALNEPYSGKDGLMYSVERHAHGHGRRALELEVRQDLAVMPGVRRRIAEATSRALSKR